MNGYPCISLLILNTKSDSEYRKAAYCASARLHSKKLSFSVCWSSSGLVLSSQWGLITRKYTTDLINATYYLYVRQINLWKHVDSNHRLGILRKCLLSSCSFISSLFSSAVNKPARASAGTNLILSFSKKTQKWMKVIRLTSRIKKADLQWRSHNI